ncbi:MAG TPA: AAA family ATPase, partial [Planctomycetota bacterium]|nr:AAA family ATPase [Planctomycetota bacterium]
LKDLARPERVAQLEVEGLAGDFPPLRTLDRVRHNLPVQLTSFIGRGSEVAEGLRLLGRARLLTLVGTGGTGKTRLGLQLAAESVERFRDGVFFVALAPISDPELVPSTIASTIGLQLSGAKPPMQQLIEHLREREVLLVLDNLEQILAAAPRVSELLQAAPGLRVLATSRAPLRVSGEQEFPVPPLGLPDPATVTLPQLSQYESVQLFIERALAATPDFRVTNESAPAVAGICARLDGLPLAIELASARIKILTPQAMLARLEKRLGIGGAVARDLPARQQTLQGAIGWSYDLLDASGKRLFERFAAFVGGAMLEQAEQVCGPDGEPGDVLAGIENLVDQSLVRQREAGGDYRFFLLQTIREYALGRLESGTEADLVRERHARAYAELAERLAPDLFSARQKELLDQFELEHDNIRAALECAIARGDFPMAARLGAATWRFWQMRGLLAEGRAWMERVLAVTDRGAHPKAELDALEAAGGLAYWQGDAPRTRELYGELVDRAAEFGDKAILANAKYNFAFTYYFEHAAPVLGMPSIKEALALWRELGDEAGVAKAQWALGGLQAVAREYGPARANLEASERLFRAQENRFGLAWALHELGLLYLLTDELGRARDVLVEAMGLFRGAEDHSGIALVLTDFAYLAERTGQHERRLRLAAAALRAEEETGTGLTGLPENWIGPLLPEGLTDADRRTMDEGRAMSREQAIAYA